MSNLLESKLGVEKSKILVCPIFEVDFFKNCNSGIEENNVNYLYVADDSPQKNHVNLLLAWSVFAKSNKNLTLHLTLDKTNFEEIINKVQIICNDQINVINHGWCSIDKIRDLYMKCNYLVYPSLAESFGLPLIEAAASGCKIIASDLPYVSEVVIPSLVFNPDNVESIIKSLNESIDFIKIPSTTLKVDNKINLLFNTN